MILIQLIYLYESNNRQPEAVNELQRQEHLDNVTSGSLHTLLLVMQTLESYILLQNTTLQIMSVNAFAWNSSTQIILQSIQFQSTESLGTVTRVNLS